MEACATQGRLYVAQCHLHHFQSQHAASARGTPTQLHSPLLARQQQPIRSSKHAAKRPARRHAVRARAQEAGSSAAAEPARVLWFCADSQEELCFATWGLTGAVIAATALAALSEIFEGRLPPDNALLPNAAYRFHEGLQLAWLVYGDQVYMHPVVTKAAISGFTYGLADLVAQTLDKRHANQVDWARTARSAAIGFSIHGPLSHLWFEQLDRQFIISRVPALEHGQAWFVPLAKIALDQTLFVGIWNALFFSSQGLLQGRGFRGAVRSVQRTWWSLLRGGWRVWPLVHLVTFCFIPREHRVLWTDSVELCWVVLISLHARQEAQRQEHSLRKAPQPQNFAEYPEYDV